MICPDDNQMLDFVEGRLPPPDAASLDLHLDSCASCREVAAELVRSSTTSGRAASVSRSTTRSLQAEGLASGDRLDRFRILGTVGSGAMGVVYEAHDPVLDRRCAIKIMRSHLADDAMADPAARVLREARALARLSHPNVVGIHEVGTVGDQVFIVMEFVDGEPLSVWRRARPRSWQQILEAFLAAGAGLSAAHALGIVHRDFKPENVLVGHDGRVRVTDFGLALADMARSHRPEHGSVEVLDSGQADEFPIVPSLTDAGAVVGTPLYMAPEVLRGEGATVASDQFSFCVALYEALFDERPFSGSTLGELRRAQERPLVFPRAPRVPRAVLRALTRGLAVSADARYPSLAALLDALHGSLAPRRRGLWIGAGALVTASVIAASSVYVSRQAALCSGSAAQMAAAWNDEARARIAAQLRQTRVPSVEFAWTRLESSLSAYAVEWVGAHEGTCRAGRIRGELSDDQLSRSMQCLDGRRLQFGALVKVLATADGDAVQRASELFHQLGNVSECSDLQKLAMGAPSLTSQADRELFTRVESELAEAGLLLAAGKYAAATELAGKVVAAARGLPSRHWEAKALVTLGVAQAKADAKAVDAARTTLLDAIVAAEAADDDRVAATAWAHLVRIEGAGRSKTVEAEQASAHASALATRLRDDEVEALRLHNLATARWSAGDFEESRKLYTQAVAIRERLHSGIHPDTISSLVGSADALSRQGRQPEAMPIYEQALKWREQLQGPDHPDVALLLTKLGSGRSYTGDQVGAEQALVRALSILEGTGAGSSVNACNTLIGLGVVYTYQEQADRGEQALRRALGTCEAATSPDHPLVSRVLNNLGEWLVTANRAKEAVPLLRRSVDIREKRLGPKHPDLAYSLGSLAGALTASGESKEAVQLLERAWKLQDRPDASPSELAIIRYRLATALMTRPGQKQRAIELAKDARARLTDLRSPWDQKLANDLDAFLAAHQGG